MIGLKRTFKILGEVTLGLYLLRNSRGTQENEDIAPPVMVMGLGVCPEVTLSKLKLVLIQTFTRRYHFYTTS